MATPNLAITHISAGQNSKEVTANTAFDEFDKALAALLSVNMANANVTLTTGEGNQALANMVFVFTSALTAARTVTVPTNKKLYVIKNATTGGFKITVKTPSGTGIDVLASDGYVFVYCDGTNVVGIGAIGSAPTTSFIGLTDVPASFSGAGLDAVEVNSGATALVFSARPYVVAGFAPGTYTNSQVILAYPVDRAVTFAGNLANSKATLTAAVTASTTFVVKKNGTQIGTIVFSTGTTATSFTTTSGAAQTFAAGDILSIEGPASADATAAGLGFSLQGTR
jgi:hypothetical protein